MRGGNDGWSGRKNDNRHARYDGVLEAAKAVIEVLNRSE